MKKILFLTISLLLAGCSASRQVLKSEATEIRKEEAAVTAETTTDLAELTQTAAEQVRGEEVITMTTVYDTSQPADSKTGTPPVKVHTTQVRRTAAKARQETSAESRQEQVRTERQTIIEQTQTKTGVETKIRRGMNGMQRILCAIGLLAAAGIAGWFLRFQFKR